MTQQQQQEPQRPEYDAVIKIVAVGDTHDAQSKFLTRFQYGTYTPGGALPVGIELGIKTVVLLAQRIRVQLFAHFGGARFVDSMSSVYYNHADGFLCCYDVTDRSTYLAVTRSTLQHVRSRARPSAPLVLLGLNAEATGAARAVSSEEGAAFAEGNDLLFAEASAATGDGVEEAVALVVQAALRPRLPDAGRGGGMRLPLAEGVPQRPVAAPQGQRCVVA